MKYLLLFLLSTSALANTYVVRCQKGAPLREFLYVNGVVPSPLPVAWGNCSAADITGREQQFVNLVRENDYPNDHQLLMATAASVLTGNKTPLQNLKNQRDATDLQYPFPIPSSTPGILGH